MKKLFLPILLAFYFLHSGCDSHNETKPATEFAPLDTDTSENDIREQKPKFLDFSPVSGHLINTGEKNSIRIITNSDQLQKIWMVYYDHKAKRWNTLTWIGSGTNNKIIADTVFNTIFGVVIPSGPIDDPTFYMAYSKDTGRTWLNHPIEKAALNCISDTAQLLVSDDFDKTNNKPAIVIILQPKTSIHPSISKSLQGWDASYLCTVIHQAGKKKDGMHSY